MEALLLTTAASWTFFIVSVTCEVAERITNEFLEIDYVIGHFDWYLYPTEVQRMLPIVIIMAQQPVVIECFGSISCSRETFKKVSGKLIHLRDQIHLNFSVHSMKFNLILDNEYRLFILHGAPSSLKFGRFIRKIF